jgi:hypothetical protein
MSVGITITFGDVAENHIGNQQIGTPALTGITYEELHKINDRLVEAGISTTIINMHEYMESRYFDMYSGLKAAVLVIHGGVNIFGDPDHLFDEVKILTYDKKAMMGRGSNRSVKNKIARHNLCFADFDQEPEYESEKGRVISFDNLPFLSHMRQYLPELANRKCVNLVAEGNCYYDIKKCGIGYHCDDERKIVIGIRVGESFPLCFYWYHYDKRISSRIEVTLNHGDIYIMSEKAAGSGEGNIKKIPKLKHAAGCNKYID